MSNSVYGSFYNFEGTSRTPQDVVSSCLDGAGAAYGERAIKNGAFDAMVTDYIAAIQDALPEGILLCGAEFIGPADGRCDKEIHQAIREAIEAADLAPIIKRRDFPLDSTWAVTAYTQEYGETHEVHTTVEAPTAEAAIAQAKTDLAERGRPNIQDAIAHLIDIDS